MSRAAPPRARLQAQATLELRLLLRNGENLLVAFGIPAGLLVLFALVDVLPTADQPPVDFLLPGVLVAATMGSALVALAISTGFDRDYLVLKRLGTTPLRRRELVAAKIGAILAVQVIQVALMVGIAVALGWPVALPLRPLGGAAAVAALALGTAAFAGIGLALAGRLRATLTLALANTLFVLLLGGSGLFFPLDALPAGVRAVVGLLPSAALVELLRGALGPAPLLLTDWGVLAVWALGAPAVAARVFRWE